MNHPTIIHWNYTHLTIFHPLITADNPKQFIGLCLLVFLVSLTPSLIQLLRIRLLKAKKKELLQKKMAQSKQMNPTERQLPLTEAESNKLLQFADRNGEGSKIKKFLRSLGYYCIVSSLQGMRMLLIMSLNGLIICSVLLGMGLGRVLVNWKEEMGERCRNSYEQEKGDIEI